MSLNSEHAKNLASTLAEEVVEVRRLMTNVATGGPRIDDVNEDYYERRASIGSSLEKLGLDDPNPYSDLWDWYHKWSSGDLPTYRSRRQYLRELYEPLLQQLHNLERGLPPGVRPEPTGWERVDRAIEKMRLQLSSAQHEEDYQQVGLLAREVLISTAQAVYDPIVHSSSNEEVPSQSDAHRMLAQYIGHELKGSQNEEIRRHAKAALSLAVSLQHRRTAEFRMACLCLEGTMSVVNIIAIISGRRDPD